MSVRTREIGIRLALGAHSTNVRALVVREGLLLTAAGLAFGLAAAFSVVLISIALVASYVPARRATRINPIATLRSE